MLGHLATLATRGAGTRLDANDFEVTLPPGLVDLGVPAVRRTGAQAGATRPSQHSTLSLWADALGTA